MELIVKSLAADAPEMEEVVDACVTSVSQEHEK
jgi:hypothetical protein